MKFFIKDFSSKYDQIRSFLHIWSHLLKKSLMSDTHTISTLRGGAKGGRVEVRQKWDVIGRRGVGT